MVYSSCRMASVVCNSNGTSDVTVNVNCNAMDVTSAQFIGRSAAVLWPAHMSNECIRWTVATYSRIHIKITFFTSTQLAAEVHWHWTWHMWYMLQGDCGGLLVVWPSFGRSSAGPGTVGTVCVGWAELWAPHWWAVGARQPPCCEHKLLRLPAALTTTASAAVRTLNSTHTATPAQACRCSPTSDWLSASPPTGYNLHRVGARAYVPVQIITKRWSSNRPRQSRTPPWLHSRKVAYKLHPGKVTDYNCMEVCHDRTLPSSPWPAYGAKGTN